MAGLLAIHPPYLSVNESVWGFFFLFFFLKAFSPFKEFGSAIENGVKGYVGVQGIYDLVELDKSFPDYRQVMFFFFFFLWISLLICISISSNLLLEIHLQHGLKLLLHIPLSSTHFYPLFIVSILKKKKYLRSSSSCHAPWLVVHSREDELVDLKQANLWLSYLNANKIAAELAIGIWGLHWDGMTAIGSDKDPISPLVAAFVTRALSHWRVERQT